MLLKKQRNEILNVLQKYDIPASGVKEDRTGDFYQLLTSLDGEQFYFYLEPHDAFYNIRMYPGNPGTKTVETVLTWPQVINYLEVWAMTLAEEADTPDLWAEATKTAQLFAPTATPSDDKFTRTELAEVQGQLRLLQQSFAAATLPEAARQKLIELTQTAAVKAEGFTKKDWQSWFIGALIGHITEAVLNSDQIHEVYKLVKTAFGGLFLY